MPHPLPLPRRSSVLVFFALLLACKKNDGEAPNGGYVQGQVGPGGAGAGGALTAGQGGSSGMAPMAAGAPQAGGAGGMATGGAAGMASGPLPQKLDPGVGSVLQPALAEIAKKDLTAGSKPIGETLVGNFGPGTSLDLPIQLQPNKCYSVAAVGIPPVAEISLELQLTTVVPGMAPVLAVDQDTGATAVIGRNKTCYKWMFGVIPAPGKVVVRVTSGSGLVVAQAYEK